MGETALRGLYHVLASSLLVMICFVKNDLPERENICVAGGHHVNAHLDQMHCLRDKEAVVREKFLVSSSAFSDRPADCNVDRARRPSTVLPPGSERTIGLECERFVFVADFPRPYRAVRGPT